MAPVDTFNLETAVQLIPPFKNGSELDLTRFENKCDFIFKHTAIGLRSHILDAIKADLEGKALEAIQYKNISTWDDLKKVLSNSFATTHSTTYLRMKLNSKKATEPVQQFADRILKTARKLTRALTIDESDNNDKNAVARTFQKTAINVFTSGVSPSVDSILKAHIITRFEEAVIIVLEEEEERSPQAPSGSTSNRSNKNRHNKNRDNSSKCRRCDRPGHFAHECRTSCHILPNFRQNPTSNSNTNVQVKKEHCSKFCKYCKKSNHDISECKKRIFNENKKQIK